MYILFPQPFVSPAHHRDDAHDVRQADPHDARAQLQVRQRGGR